jgi:hypothetical protein
MSTVLQAVGAPPTWASRQAWILGPTQDALFVVAAPLLVLIAAVAAFALLGAADATASILLLHVVLTVAHHLPTFIRVYGDLDLFRRFKWTFILAPVLPLSFAAAALVYLNAHAYPIENVLYLFVLLALWDPWHFLMQHYGFARIYDRHNAAPRKLAAHMDLVLSAAWFVFIMLASGEWLVGILEDLFLTANLSAAALFPSVVVHGLTFAMFAAAALATLAYGVYLVWCRRRGYFISVVKLALFVTTFGVMFIAYTPNFWILSWAPGWTFNVGFAVIGIVHMTQYLAIVWRYNRSLATQPGRARSGVFGRLHGRGGWLAGAGYVALCLLYGAALTSQHENRWLMSVLLALGFTSTLLHYYFDGFIWKLRHAQNRDNLDDKFERAAQLALSQGPRPPERESSWWTAVRQRSVLAIALRQAVYFGVPLTIVSAGALAVLNGPGANYVGYMMRGAVLFQEGHEEQALQQARSALASMEWQLPVEQSLTELQPTAPREAALAFLIYNRSQYAEILIPTLTGQQVGAERAARHRASVAAAIGLLEQALRRGGSIGHSGREEMRREDAYKTLASWRKEMD